MATLLFDHHDSILKYVTDSLGTVDRRSFRLVSKKARDVFPDQNVHGLSDRIRGVFVSMLLTLSSMGAKWSLPIEAIDDVLKFDGQGMRVGHKVNLSKADLENYVRMQMLFSRTGIDISVTITHASAPKVSVMQAVEKAIRDLKTEMKTVTIDESSTASGFTGAYQTPLRFNVNFGAMILDANIIYNAYWTKTTKAYPR